MAWVQLPGTEAQGGLVFEAQSHMKRTVGTPGLERLEAQTMLQVGSGELRFKELEIGKAEAWQARSRGCSHGLLQVSRCEGFWATAWLPGDSALFLASVLFPVPCWKSSRVPEGAPFPTFSHKELGRWWLVPCPLNPRVAKWLGQLVCSTL